MTVSVDDAGRSHPAQAECRVLPKGRVGGEVRKVRGSMCGARAGHLMFKDRY